LLGGHTIKQSSRASPDLFTPLTVPHCKNVLEKISSDLATIPDIQIQLLFLFVDTCSAPLSVSERHGSEIKQLSAAIGMARKQSYFGGEVDVLCWPVAARPHKPSLAFNKYGSSAVESS